MIRKFLLAITLQLLCKVLDLRLKLLVSHGNVACLFTLTEVRAARRRRRTTLITHSSLAVVRTRLISIRVRVVLPHR